MNYISEIYVNSAVSGAYSLQIEDALELKRFITKYKETDYDDKSSLEYYGMYDDNSNLIGGIVLDRDPDDSIFESHGKHIDAMVLFFTIDSEYQSQGIGRKLFNDVVPYKENVGIVVNSSIQNQLRLYKTAGFKMIDRNGNYLYLYR